MRLALTLCIVVAAAAGTRALGAPRVPANSVAGSGTVVVAVSSVDLTGRYRASLADGDLDLTIGYDAKGGLSASGSFGGEAFAARGVVKAGPSGPRVSLRSATRGTKLTLTGLAGATDLAGTFWYRSATLRTGGESQGVPVSFELPQPGARSVPVTWSFSQTASGAVRATAGVRVFGGATIPVRGRGRVTVKGSREVARISMRGRGSRVVLTGPVRASRFDATWTLTLPGGVRKSVAFAPLPPDANLPSFHGQVTDARTGAPVPLARVTIPGTADVAETGPDGRFELAVPDTGTHLLLVEHEAYAYAHRRVDAVAGLDAAVPPVRLLPLDAAVTRIGPAGGTHTSADGAVVVTIPPGAVADEIDVRATNAQTSDEIPPLPPASDFTYCVNLRPELQQFAVPVTCRIRNDLGFLPGTPIPVGIYRKDGDRWEHETMAAVTDDGAWVEFRCTGFSFHDCNLPAVPRSGGAAPPGPREIRPSGNSDPPPQDGPGRAFPCGSRVGIADGQLLVEHSTPSYRSLGMERAVRLVYASRSVTTTARISADYDLFPPAPGVTGTTVPDRHVMRVSVGGGFTEKYFRATEEPARYALLWDGRTPAGARLASGVYPWRLEVGNVYDDATYSTAAVFGGPALFATGVAAREPAVRSTGFTGTVFLRNEHDSPFGAGWTIAGFHRLHSAPDGAYVVDAGDGSAVRFGAGLLSTLAGTGGTASTPAGDGGPATAAPLPSPAEVEAAPDGSVLVADTTHRVVRRIDAAGTITTFAGVATGGTLADDVPALTARFVDPCGLWVSTSGAVYVADGTGARIRRIGNGTVTTVAGTGTQGVAGPDGSPAVASAMRDVRDVVAAPDGTFWFADRGNRHVRRVDPDGLVTTVAGGGSTPVVGAGVPARDARLEDPSGLALAPDGTLFISDRGAQRILALGTDGILRPVAGNGLPGYSGDGGPALDAALFRPEHMTIDRDGTLLFAESGNYRVRRIADDGTIRAVVGYGTVSGDGVPATTGRLGEPTAVAVLPDGRIVVADRLNRRVRIVDPSVHVTDSGAYGTLRRSPDGTSTWRRADGSTVEFDAGGTESATADANGNRSVWTTVRLAGRDFPATLTDPVGRVTEFEYRPDGRLAAVADPAGRRTSFDIDAFGDLVAIVNPDDSVRTFGYAAGHLLTRTTDAGGTVTEYQFGSDGAVERIVKAAGLPEEQVREFTSHLASGAANLEPEDAGTPANPLGTVNPEEILDGVTGAGPEATVSTDDAGSPVRVLDGLGNETRYERSALGLVTRVVAPMGQSFSYTYDARRNIASVTEDATGASVRIESHPSYSLPLRITDSHGGVTQFDADARGNRIAVTDPAGARSVATVDARGRTESATDATGRTTRFSYDEDGNLERITDPAGASTWFACDDAGHIVAVTDGEGRRTDVVRDVMNRVVEIRDPAGAATTFTWEPAKGTHDASSREPAAVLTSVRLPSGVTTTFTWDPLARLAARTDGAGNSVLCAYDDDGRLVRRTSARGVVTTFEYDEAGRLTARDPGNGDRTEISWDSDSRVTRIADADSEVSLTWDAYGRLVYADTAPVAGFQSSSIRYWFDTQGRLRSRTDPSGGISNYAYTARGQIRQIADAGRVFDFAYDAAGRRESTTGPAGTMASAITRNPAGAIAGIRYTIPGDGMTIATFDYEYDRAGNVVAITEDGARSTFSYDAATRLVRATRPGLPDPAESYSWGPDGRRTASHTSAVHTYDDAGRLVADATYDYEHDEDGNLVRRTAHATGATTTHEYDHENRLVRSTSPDGTVTTHRYDGFGRRIERVTGTTVRRWVWDGYQPLQELDENGVIARFTHGPGTDELLAVTRDGLHHFVARDLQGSVRLVKSYSVGAPAREWTASYDSFGVLLESGGDPDIGIGFAGRETDPATGLSYFRARHYAPELGRFLQSDPADLTLRDGGPWNYCRSNPLSRTDPFGLWSVEAGVTGSLPGGFLSGSIGFELSPDGVFLNVGFGASGPSGVSTGMFAGYGRYTPAGAPSEGASREYDVAVADGIGLGYTLSCSGNDPCDSRCNSSYSILVGAGVSAGIGVKTTTKLFSWPELGLPDPTDTGRPGRRY